MARFKKCTSTLVAIAVVALLQFSLATESASAQAGALGNIIGKAADETGGVLPGVTVTATSPALLVPSVTTAGRRVLDHVVSALSLDRHASIEEILHAAAEVESEFRFLLAEGFNCLRIKQEVGDQAPV